MGSAEEIASGVWVVSDDSGRNSGILLDERCALLVDPSSHAAFPEVVRKALRESMRDAATVVLTRYRMEEVPVHERWPGATTLGLGALTGSASLPRGWEPVALRDAQNETVGLNNATQKILFCGEILSGSEVPALRSSSLVYIARLERLKELDTKLVVPAVGTVARGKREVRERIERELNYLQWLRRHVITTIIAAVPLTRALEAARSAYEEYPYVETHLANLHFVWEEVAERHV